MRAFVSVTKTEEKPTSPEEIWNILQSGYPGEKFVEVLGSKQYGWIRLERVPGAGNIVLSYEDQDPKPLSAVLRFGCGYVNSVRELQKRLVELGVEP